MDFITELAKQGPLIIALIAAIKYFYTKQNEMEVAAKEQSEKIETLLKEDRKEMVRIIENNTRVLEQNNEILSTFAHRSAKHN